MITMFLLCWIGIRLNAPVWYYTLAGISFCVRTFDAYRYATRKNLGGGEENKKEKKEKGF